MIRFDRWAGAADLGRCIAQLADKDPINTSGTNLIFLSIYRDLIWAARTNYNRHANIDRLKSWKRKKVKHESSCCKKET